MMPDLVTPWRGSLPFLKGTAHSLEDLNLMAQVFQRIMGSFAGHSTCAHNAVKRKDP